MPDGAIDPGLAIVLKEPPANIAGRHADNGILRRVVSCRFAKHSDADAALPQLFEFSAQRLLDNVLQEFLAALAALEGGAIANMIQVFTDLPGILERLIDP